MKTLLTIEGLKVIYLQNLRNIQKVGGNVEVKRTSTFIFFNKIPYLGILFTKLANCEYRRCGPAKIEEGNF